MARQAPNLGGEGVWGGEGLEGGGGGRGRETRLMCHFKHGAPPPYPMREKRLKVTVCP